MSEKTGDEKRGYKVSEAEFKGIDFDIAQYSVTVPVGVAFEDIKDDPTVWVHIARRLREGNILHMHTPDHAWYARCYVVTAQAHAAKIHVLEYHKFAQAVLAPQGYTVAWAGPNHKWRVVRVSDNQVMEHGFKTEADAAAYADELKNKLAA